ncbi:hypothetical protein [Mesobacillus boroniphilus]|nr:hypothetical protein [Mesobacillus boroniphilus]
MRDLQNEKEDSRRRKHGQFEKVLDGHGDSALAGGAVTLLENRHDRL